jgi:diguanylate cyclase (GGDEF)-like protein
VAIERIQVQDRWREVRGANRIELPEDVRDLAFEFTALSFQDPASVLLRYRLVGYDAAWRDLKVVSPRSVNYTNLPAGEYSFEVKAANNAGAWNPRPARLAFAIKPHFHETGVFQLLLSTLLLTILYAAWRTQRLSHLEQRNLLGQQVAERTQELHAANMQFEHASQSDPLTGLRNRRYLANQLPVDLAFYRREQARFDAGEQVMVFALVDIDHFQRVNAAEGERGGDRVLQQFAQLLLRSVRAGDYVVRWSGEQFLLVFRPLPRRHVALIGERIRGTAPLRHRRRQHAGAHLLGRTGRVRLRQRRRGRRGLGSDGRTRRCRAPMGQAAWARRLGADARHSPLGAAAAVAKAAGGSTGIARVRPARRHRLARPACGRMTLPRVQRRLR